MIQKFSFKMKSFKMTTITGFSDSNNIIIGDDKIAYFRYTGNTYKDKLKNGLSLDYVFYIEDNFPKEEEYILYKDEDNKNIEKNICNYYEEDADFYEKLEKLVIFKGVKKGKSNPLKKRKVRNMKKNCIKSNGNSYKLFIIEQNLGELNYDKDITYDLYDDNYSRDNYDYSFSDYYLNDNYGGDYYDYYYDTYYDYSYYSGDDYHF